MNQSMHASSHNSHVGQHQAEAGLLTTLATVSSKELRRSLHVGEQCNTPVQVIPDLTVFAVLIKRVRLHCHQKERRGNYS